MNYIPDGMNDTKEIKSQGTLNFKEFTIEFADCLCKYYKASINLTSYLTHAYLFYFKVSLCP